MKTEVRATTGSEWHWVSVHWFLWSFNKRKDHQSFPTGAGLTVGYEPGKFAHPIGSNDPEFGYEYVHGSMGYDKSANNFRCQVANATAYFGMTPGKNM